LAQFRSTADILDLALANGGEVTNGNSPYETQILNYLNRVHFTLIAGGTIPVGKDATVEIDEVWPWAKSKTPLLLELQPKYETGTITLTIDSEIGAFSAAPSISLKGYHIKVSNRDEWFKIASHTAASTAFELDSAYPDATGSGFVYEAVKLDYELIPSYIVIDQSNDKFQFQKVLASTVTATLTHGSYTPAQLATHVAAVATAATTVITITGSYSTITRKFSFVSDLAGASAFYINGVGDQSEFSVHKTLGFDDELSSNAATQTSAYVLGGICRLVEPFKINKGSAKGGSIYGIDTETFQRNYPFPTISEGIPTKFTVIKESSNGTFTVRFNAYPEEKTRIEVEHVAIPRDLKDSSLSIPLIPRKHSDVLEDAATFYLMLNKSDDRAMTYATLMQGKLKAMVSQHRGAQVRSGEFFGQIIPRRDLMGGGRRKLFPRDPY